VTVNVPEPSAALVTSVGGGELTLNRSIVCCSFAGLTFLTVNVPHATTGRLSNVECSKMSHPVLAF